ncbi:MAG: hypothetical protein ALAOOOJD_01750 [bacterium]|nr:hypothetical protein [bacterium]
MDQPIVSLSADTTVAAKPASPWVKSALGYLVALGCLVWVFHDIHVARLWESFIHINWWLIALAIFFDIASYYCQGIRWELLLRPLGKITPLRTTQAIYVGLFTNEIVPLRPGELVRAYLVSRWLPAEFVSVIPSLAVERLFDGVWLALAIAVAAFYVPLPKDVLNAEEILGVIMIIALGWFAYLMLGKRRVPNANDSGWKPLRAAKKFFARLGSEMRQIGAANAFYSSYAVSLFILVCQIMAFWLVMRACGLEMSLWAGAVVLLIVHIGTAIPNAPSNVGTYQFFTVVGLGLFRIDKTLATGFSVVVFIVLTVPLWVLGLLAISRTGMTLATIRGEITQIINKTGK